MCMSTGTHDLVGGAEFYFYSLSWKYIFMQDKTGVCVCVCVVHGREGGRVGKREGRWKEGRKEGRREGGREGGREGEREGGSERREILV